MNGCRATGSQAAVSGATALRPGVSQPIRAALAAASVCLALAGCQGNELDVSYGRREGMSGDASINGIDALASMFAAAGHDVTTRHSLSPSLTEAQTVIWFPDNFKAPGEEVCDWFDDWLNDGNGHTLIYVGRGYDAAPDYLDATRPLAKPQQQREYDAHRLDINSRLTRRHKLKPDSEECSWFSLSDDGETHKVESLQGPWAAGIDASKVSISTTQQMQPPEWDEWLLESDGQPLVVSRIAAS